MAIFLKKIKRDLARHASLVGTDAAGNYLYEPPTVISRELRNYARLRVPALDRTVSISARTVNFKALVTSEKSATRKYVVEIQFTQIVMAGREAPELTNQTPVLAGKHVGRIAFWKTPVIAANPVKLYCSCPDFRHRFSYELDAHDALIGKTMPYTRETLPWQADGSGGYPYANALGKVGICKHVYSLIIHLKARKLITER